MKRQAFRESLSAQGFRRVAFTDVNDTDDTYTETWTDGNTTVVVSWGPRKS